MSARGVVHHATEFLTHAERESVVRAIAEAESRTAAEIVCAVATESGRYDRAESLMGLATALIVLVAGHALVPPGTFSSLSWQVGAVAVGFLAGTVLASYTHSIRRVFSSPREMAEEVDRAANHVFLNQRMTGTRDASGLLIYVSLYEQRVAIRADDGIRNLLGQSFLDDVCRAAITELNRGVHGGVFLRAIERAMHDLESRMPVRPDDTNEIPNALLVFHPRP